ncbi:Trypsin iota-like Protein [Tribolium castaneum]|uniref:Trypsin iota-like Protein n=1 Tax=Tribolium castaneum TaxID=7070 RepID=D6WDH8_TRICA|nr:PREDICTED: chymotrypsin-1 isoform X1 [Tribolium castaneum]EEZ99970.2 Trypsin iota-like Protein [Tribolium castaneum]|eukprot:XP_015833628.1 PREDICTED: chymotrypsin-1 isoform X1 [Tribolium castaneum]
MLSTKILIILVIILFASPFTCACDENEFKFMVQLITLDFENNQRDCAGSYIAEKYILTAAHCVNNTKEIHIVDNDENQLKSLILDSNKASVIHEKFCENKEKHRLDNDIALIHLNDNQVAQIKRNIALRTISVSYDYDISEKTELYVLGWGTSDPNAVNDKLEKKSVRKKNCEEEINDESVVCTHKDNVYKGDSGGPLIADDKQIGIVSGGVEESILYTFLPYYKSWIAKNVEGPETDKNSSTEHVIIAVTMILCLMYINFIYF